MYISRDNVALRLSRFVYRSSV